MEKDLFEKQVINYMDGVFLKRMSLGGTKVFFQKRINM